MIDIVYIQICGSWSAWDVTNAGYELDSFWQNHLFVLDSNLLNELYIGQLVDSFTNVSPLDGGFVPQYKVGGLVYQDNNSLDIYSESAANRTLIGCLLLDNDNNLLKFFDYDDVPVTNTGTICLNVVENKEEIEIVNNFNQKVLSDQCCFAYDVEKYIQKLEYGIKNNEMFLDLNNRKKSLEILNNYDRRDIYEDTTLYNNISFSKIKKLLQC